MKRADRHWNAYEHRRELAELRARESVLVDLIGARVRAAVRTGDVTWSEVGEIFGLSAEGARYRWGRERLRLVDEG